jgi:hypothetical protein
VEFASPLPYFVLPSCEHRERNDGERRCACSEDGYSVSIGDCDRGGPSSKLDSMHSGDSVQICTIRIVRVSL